MVKGGIGPPTFWLLPPPMLLSVPWAGHIDQQRWAPASSSSGVAAGLSAVNVGSIVLTSVAVASVLLENFYILGFKRDIAGHILF